MTLSGLTGIVLGERGHFWSSWHTWSLTMTSEHLGEADIVLHLKGTKLGFRAAESIVQGLTASQQVAKRRLEPSCT